MSDLQPTMKPAAISDIKISRLFIVPHFFRVKGPGVPVMISKISDAG
jgi:hypothetical protein